MNIQYNLSIIRGESKTWKFQRRTVDGEVITETPTAMYFSVKRNYDDASNVLQKSLSDGFTYNNGWWSLFIPASDTENLQPGMYVCDLKVLSATYGETYIVEPQSICVKPSVTRHV